MNAVDTLRSQSGGFRERFLDYDELTGQLQRWADAFPGVVRVTSIGQSTEGRELWLITLGPDPERMRPAVWVDGNMHASELCGSSVALAIAEDVLRLHLDDTPNVHGLPAHVVAHLRDVLFYVLPRMSPDGAEAVLKTGRFVRSVPRDLRQDRNRARWLAQDMDNDGLALLMRKDDPSGEYVESREISGLMLERQLEDEGPFYKLYPEGVVENYDGVTVPSPGFLSDNPVDLNRNFPFFWAPETEQEGAGLFPLSEPESRAVVEFTAKTPHLFAWLNLHTFGGVFIRPLGDRPDSDMDPMDLALFRQIEAWGERYTSYPTVSGYEEFTYKPKTPLRGDLIEYAYHQRGCIAYVCELWDLFRQVGLESKKPYVDNYTHLTREDVLRIARWDAEHNDRRLFPAWRAFTHPQLGRVEIGGLDPRFGMWNPPTDRMPAICEGQSAMFLRVAAMAPCIIVTAAQTCVGDNLTRVDITVANQGYLPTFILSSARKQDWNETLYAEVTTEGCELDDPRTARREVGHLDGWGRGLFSGGAGLHFQRSGGNLHMRRLSWLVCGTGTLRCSIGACRVGWTTTRIEVGERVR